MCYFFKNYSAGKHMNWENPENYRVGKRPSFYTTIYMSGNYPRFKDINNPLNNIRLREI